MDQAVRRALSPAEDNGFSGGGFHRDDCQFGCPDDESYPF